MRRAGLRKAKRPGNGWRVNGGREGVEWSRWGLLGSCPDGYSADKLPVQRVQTEAQGSISSLRETRQRRPRRLSSSSSMHSHSSFEHLTAASNHWSTGVQRTGVSAGRPGDQLPANELRRFVSDGSRRPCDAAGCGVESWRGWNTGCWVLVGWYSGCDIAGA